MTAATVLRVKRRLEDNPHDALVLTCKRIKTDTEREEIARSLFIFQGTVLNQEPTLVSKIVPKNDVKLQMTHNVNDVIDKIRKERKEVSTESRYEVVNLCRGVKKIDDDDDDDQFDLVDLQEKLDSEKNDTQYAYDVYTAVKRDFDINMLDNLIGIENYESQLLFGSSRDNGRHTPSSTGEESDDSNDENNWRNDYPDEQSSIDEDDMIRAMERCDLDELSSDTGEDRIYEEPSFQEDVTRYGMSYAKYKAKVLAEDSDLPTNSLVHSNKSEHLMEDPTEGYKDDSDNGFYYGQEEDTYHYREQYEQDSSDEYTPD